MENQKPETCNRAFQLRGVYIRNSNNNEGQPVFLEKTQEFREFNDRIELWEKNGDGQMHLIENWSKQSITHVEYREIPNTWITVSLQ